MIIPEYMLNPDADSDEEMEKINMVVIDIIIQYTYQSNLLECLEQK